MMASDQVTAPAQDRVRPMSETFHPPVSGRRGHVPQVEQVADIVIPAVVVGMDAGRRALKGRGVRRRGRGGAPRAENDRDHHGKGDTCFALNADDWKAKRPRREQPVRPIGCIDRGTGAARSGNMETARSSAPPGSGPRIAVRPPRTWTKSYFCRRTFS